MIGKGKAVSHTAESLGYAMEKDKAEVLEKTYLVGETPEEIEKEMKTFQNLNGRCENNTFSFVLSPSIEDGNRLTNEDYKRISKKFLKELKLEEHQSIIVKHNDRNHKHLHIYVNRIDMQGKATEDHHIGMRVQNIADKIAQEENLTRAQEVKKQKELEKKPAKERIQAVFDDALKHSKNRRDFFEKVTKKGVELKASVNKQGITQGYRAEMNGESFKASEIGNKYTLKKIDKTIEKSVVMQQKQEQNQSQHQEQKNNHSRGMRI